MLTVNIDIADRLINGQIGTVKHILTDRGNVVKIYILMDDSNAGLKKRNSDAVARQNLWIPVEKAEASIRLRANKELSPVIKRTQFPLMLAWACTVHKDQGLSLDKAVINFDLLKRRCFNYGKMCVALSRVTSLNGLYLTGEYKPSAIKADPRAIHEYERIRDESVITPNAKFGMLTYNSLAITLLNVRSFPKHAIDISHSEMLLQTDVFCFTETQLLLNREIADTISENLDHFNFLHNRCNDQFQSISFCYRVCIDILENHNAVGRSILSFTKCSFSLNPVKLLLLYRKLTGLISDFYQTLTDLLRTNNIDIVLGDLNMNAQNQPNQLLQIFSDYKQIVTEPT